MFRTSGFLAIAFSVAALGSATVPASAMPNGFHPQPIAIGKPNLQPIKPPQGLPSGGLKPIGVVNLGPKKPPVVDPPKLPPPPPPKVPKPIIGMPIDNVCPLNKWKCPPNPPKPPQPGKPPIVVVLPPVQVGIPVPVGVPVGIPGHVPSYGGGGYIPPQPRPVIQQAVQSCKGATVPALASGIDQLLPTAQLSDDDKARVTSLRQSIQELATDGKETAARDTEEIAMNILGYQKVKLDCGAFDWGKIPADVHADAGQTK